MSVTSSAILSTSMTITPINTSNIISKSIINRLISKFFSRHLHSPGSHQSSRFRSVTQWLTNPGSIASHYAKKLNQTTCVQEITWYLRLPVLFGDGVEAMGCCENVLRCDEDSSTKACYFACPFWRPDQWGHERELTFLCLFPSENHSWKKWKPRNLLPPLFSA